MTRTTLLREMKKNRAAYIMLTPFFVLFCVFVVLPVLSAEFDSTDVLFYHALRVAKEAAHLQPGDNVVMTGGITNGRSGNTNLIKIEAVQ